MAPIPKSGPVLPEPRLYSRTMAASADDEICISGIAGKFPRCDNVQQFADNLYQKVRIIIDGWGELCFEFLLSMHRICA